MTNAAPRSDADAGIPSDLIAMLIETWASISELVADLDEAGWKQPSELPGWTVQDLVSHVIGTEGMFLGYPSAPARTTETPHVRNPLGDIIENEVELRRDRPGAEVFAEWEATRAARVQQMTDGDAAYFAQESFTPAGPGTIADFLVFRVLDCWIHEQDLRRVLGRPGNLGNAAAEHTINRLLLTVPMVVGKRAGVPSGSAVQVAIVPDASSGDGVTRDVVVEVVDGRARYVDEPSSPPIATLTFGTEPFLVLATGRRTPEQVTSVAGAITVTGDADYAQRIIDNFNAMI